MRLFVSNIDYKTTEDDLRQLFVDAGYLPRSVRICTEKGTDKSRGFGFVELPGGHNDGMEAIENIDGEELNGRRINVREAVDEPMRGGRREHAYRR